MTKAKIKIDITDAGYSFAELALSNSTNLSFGFDVTDGALTVYRQEWEPFAQTVADISPKKLRKFARALLALADQVDPPAPVVRYFRVDEVTFYKVTDSAIELFSNCKKSWTPTTTGATTVEELSRHWYGHLVEITPDALPLAARPA